jgi:hypothetical protein
MDKAKAVVLDADVDVIMDAAAVSGSIVPPVDDECFIPS